MNNLACNIKHLVKIQAKSNVKFLICASIRSKDILIYVCIVIITEILQKTEKDRILRICIGIKLVRN